MSADASASWKIVLPCTRAEAEALMIGDSVFPTLDDQPVLNTLEPDPSRPEEWLLEAHVEDEPDAETIAAVRALVGPASVEPRVEKVSAQDWVTLSQAGLEPIRAGRFHVHTAAHADSVPRDAVAFRIEAGRAFGTGQHATTAGCLEMLDRLRSKGARADTILDVGTGTGLLAFAALALWPRARVVASDIDPVSIEVTEENAHANAVPLGGGRGELELAVADGLDHPRIIKRAAYDLVIANILAPPLIALAPAIAALTQPAGSVILAGLLATQADAVAAAYRRGGFRLADRIDTGEWTILRMRMKR